MSELINIRLKDCKYNNRSWTISIVGKGAKGRKVFLPGDVYFEARELFYGKEYLFEPRPGEPYSRDTVGKELSRQARRKLGWNIHVHTLRHSKAMYLKTLGLSADQIAKALGHKNITTTLAYYMHGTPGPEDQGVM